MPFTYTIDTNLGVIFLKADGVILDSEILAVARDYNSDPNFNPDLRLLGDYSGVTTNRLTSNNMAECARLNRFSMKSRRCLLVSRSLEFGMFRVYEAQCSMNNKPPPNIFYKREDALAYLNQGFPPEKHIT